MAREAVFSKKRSNLRYRGVHLDLKGTQPTPKRLAELLKIFAAARYNAVLVEWEDTFPWTVDPRFRSETAYTAKDIQRFVAEARRLGIEVIPLVQCLGHMETPLRVAGYERLREVPYDSFVLNPLAKGARELVQSMVEDVIATIPGLKYFHLGGDEAWSFGTHPTTKAYIKKHGKGQLYMQHVEPILDGLNARGIRPILWHDMMVHWDSKSLRNLARKADLLTWGYKGHPDTTTGHFATKHIERFVKHKITLWGGTAYKGADGHNVDLPDHVRRQENALAWAEVARRYDYVGVIATAWSRYCTDIVQCEPIDACLDELVNVGVILHDGKPPAGGLETCIRALDAMGEKKRFLACREAMRKLTAARKAAWQHVQAAREQIVTSTQDGRRRGSAAVMGRLKLLRKSVVDAMEAAAMARKAFAGLMPAIWIQRYVDERVEPLREELAMIDARLRQVDPVLWQAISE